MAVLALCCLVMGACDDVLFSEGPEVELIQTDQVEYLSEVVGGEGHYTRYAFIVVARFRNETGHTLSLSRCEPDSPTPLYGIEALGAEDGVPAGYSPFWACVGHDAPLRVEPGETRVDTLRIEGPNSWNGLTGEPRGVLEGLFRLHYLTECAECPDKTSGGLYLSNAFRVTVVD